MTACFCQNMLRRLKWRFGFRVTPKNMWLGVYLSEDGFHICPLPCLTFFIRWTRCHWCYKRGLDVDYAWHPKCYDKHKVQEALEADCS